MLADREMLHRGQRQCWSDAVLVVPPLLLIFAIRASHNRLAIDQETLFGFTGSQILIYAPCASNVELRRN